MAAYWEITAHLAYDIFFKYKYLVVNLVNFSHLGFWSGNFFLIAPFPDHCLLVPCSFDPYLVRCALSLTMAYRIYGKLVNTQEAVAASRHDRKIVGRDVKPQYNTIQYKCYGYQVLNILSEPVSYQS